jgi:hypothetical protein
VADDLAERAAALRREAVEHLTLLAGTASMCALARSGRSFPAAKYHEGRQAAATQVLRDLRDGTAAAVALAARRETWARTLTDAEGRGGDWVAYATGGLDALAELAESQPKRPEM